MFQAERQLSCNDPQNVEKLGFLRLVWIPAEILALVMHIVSGCDFIHVCILELKATGDRLFDEFSN